MNILHQLNKGQGLTYVGKDPFRNTNRNKRARNLN